MRESRWSWWDVALLWVLIAALLCVLSVQVNAEEQTTSITLSEAREALKALAERDALKIEVENLKLVAGPLLSDYTSLSASYETLRAFAEKNEIARVEAEKRAIKSERRSRFWLGFGLGALAVSVPATVVSILLWRNHATSSD